MLTQNLRLSRVLQLFWPHIIGFFLWGIVAVVVNTTAHHPEWWGMDQTMTEQAHDLLAWTAPGIPFAAIAALGSALAIFLGFRNNSAYDRWWEARKIWGALVNDSRSWCRQIVAWVEPATNADDPEASRIALVKELVHRHLAFVHGLGMHLRKQPELQAKVAEFVPEAEAERYRDVPNVITALLIEQGKRVSQARREGQIEHFRHLMLDNMLTRLSDIQGKCERIKNTPLPRQYDAFPRWFAYIYGLLLPFGMIETMGWGAVPLSVLITILFLALENSGRVIEDPFENTAFDTPMTALSVTIERDLRAALDEPLPSPTKPDEHGVVL